MRRLRIDGIQWILNTTTIASCVEMATLKWLLWRHKWREEFDMERKKQEDDEEVTNKKRFTRYLIGAQIL